MKGLKFHIAGKVYKGFGVVRVLSAGLQGGRDEGILDLWSVEH